MKKLQTIIFLLLCTTSFSQKNVQPTIDVIGEGVVYVIPDEVTIKVQVENEGKNPKELKQLNDRIVNEVLLFIKNQNIDSKDVMTQYIRLSKNYDYQTKTYKYVASQSISVRLKDLSKYEIMMSGLLESGINRIDGIYFSSSKKEEHQSQARIKAIQNAKKKAEEYVGVLGQSIGKAVKISEYQSVNYPQPRYDGLMKAMSDENSGMGQQTISPGEIELRVAVNVSFILN